METLSLNFMTETAVPENINHLSIKVVRYTNKILGVEETFEPAPGNEFTWEKPLPGSEYYLGFLNTGRGGIIEIRYNKEQSFMMIRGPVRTDITFELEGE
ncbi:hypothetical protein YUBABA_02390 [Serratia phage vB_SmaM-Yubaba]|nr:hypothetical protein YUBABA_02390 [Serratia phage vB_SmaM-Yubaba]